MRDSRLDRTYRGAALDARDRRTAIRDDSEDCQFRGYGRERRERWRRRQAFFFKENAEKSGKRKESDPREEKTYGVHLDGSMNEAEIMMVASKPRVTARGWNCICCTPPGTERTTGGSDGVTVSPHESYTMLAHAAQLHIK